MRTRIVLMIIAILTITGMVLAGTTGKIKGKVTFKDNGEAAVGANVIVDGTTLGASVDVNGDYVIFNVPAGNYTIHASMVGYHAPPVVNVRVVPDLTTELSFQMVPQEVELPVVQIVAERPLVNKSATNATRILTSQDLQAIPVRGLQGVFALQPGVVLQDNQLYIRGGRSDEVGYYVEGASTRDVLTGGNAVTLIPEAVEQFQIQAGGYNAEYGGANAGIVRQELRSGLSNFKITYQGETDRLNGDFSNSFLNTYSYGYWDNVLTVSGPLYQDKIKLFFAGENQFQRDRTPTVWTGFEFPNAQFPQPLVDGPGGGKPGDTLYAGSGAPASSIDPRYGAVSAQSGNLPMDMQNRWTGNGTLSFDFNPVLVRLGAAVTWQRQNQNPLPVYSLLDQARLPLLDNSTGLFNLKITHLVTPKTFYEVNLNYFDARMKRYDPVLGDNIMQYGDSITAAQHGLPFFSYMNGLVGLSPSDARYYGFPFARYGQLIVGGAGTNVVPFNSPSRYLKLHQNYFGGSLDVTSQTGIHEFKVGASLQSYTVRQYTVANLENVFLQFISKPDSARNAVSRDNVMRSAGLPNNFGYDLFGNEIDDGIDAPKHPKFIAAYLQDKIEYKDLIINAGLRFDYFDTDDRYFIDPTDPTFLNNDIFHIDPAALKTKDPFKAVSPRLGFAFPVSDRTVFHLQYGKFIQAPSLNDIYLGSSELALFVSGRNFITTPVGFGLDPERTTQYELGFSQQITDFASFDITGFYKDIKGQIQDYKVITSSASLARSYHALVNGDFATTKGMEFTFTMRRINRIQARLNYTLSDAQGTGSTPFSAISAIDNGTTPPTVISPLTYNQTHRGSVNIDYHFAKDDGGPILEQLGANLLFSFNSGHNFTLVTGGLGQTGPEDGGLLFDRDPRNRHPLEAVNASTTPWNFSLDMRVDKTLNLSDLLNLNVYVYVQNLLNTQNVINVYGRTGNAYDDGFLTNPDLSNQIINAPGRGDPYVAMYQDINLADRQHYWKDQGGDLYGVPRQVRVGLRLEY